MKNPNWQEADHLDIYNRSQEVGLGAIENTINQQSEQDLNPGPTDSKSGAKLTTQPCSLYIPGSMLLGSRLIQPAPTMAEFDFFS